jgi:hypothetical protein
MAVEYVGGGHITGLSSDSKPIADIPTGTTFKETDTGLVSQFNGTSWVTLNETRVTDDSGREIQEQILTQMKIMNAYWVEFMGTEIKTFDVN